MVNTEIRLIMFFAAKDGEALYSQQKQDQELTEAHTKNSILPNTEIPHAPKPEARGSGREELPHAPMPEAKGSGREEKPHARGQGQWPGGPIPHPRNRGCVGAGGPRGAIPRRRSGRAVVRRYPSSKIRSNGCSWLEQL